MRTATGSSCERAASDGNCSTRSRCRERPCTGARDKSCLLPRGLGNDEREQQQSQDWPDESLEQYQARVGAVEVQAVRPTRKPGRITPLDCGALQAGGKASPPVGRASHVAGPPSDQSLQVEPEVTAAGGS